MTDPRDSGPLSDAALDRAIVQALAVEPSPSFVARVRSRVSCERPLQARRGWWAIGLTACATPVVLVALYVGVPGRTVIPADADLQPGGRLTAAESAVRGAPDAEAVRAEPPREAAVPAGAQGDRRPREPLRAVRRAAAGPPAAPNRRTILMPEIVISASEVSAIAALARTRAPRPDAAPAAAEDRAEATDGGGTRELDLADLTIPPLVVEPLQLTARIQGEGE